MTTGIISDSIRATTARKADCAASSWAAASVFARGLQVACACLAASLLIQSAYSAPANSPTASDAGPINLTPARQDGTNGGEEASRGTRTDSDTRARTGTDTDKGRRYEPSDFERYVQRATGADKDIRRFGAELMSPDGAAAMQATSSAIPGDYLIGVGDEILVTIWGSVDADLRLTVDRSGRITLPRVGPVMVAGTRYSDLNANIDTRVAQVFRNYKLSASMGKLRGIRIYVTGFTHRPGAYTVSSLSTLVNALMQAGGPSSGGSFRNIELRRGGKLMSRFDLYALLINGDKGADLNLQAEDVIHIDAVGPQVALIGSVNKPAIFELKPQETLDQLLAMAGGFTAVADRSRLSLERIDARTTERIITLSLPEQGKMTPHSGDLLRAFSAVEATLPQNKQNKRILVEGEVARPGEYVLPASSTLNDAVRAAGGLTPKAYLFGTDLSRESVRVTQQENYDRALREFEAEFTKSASTRKTLSADEAAAQAAQNQGTARLIASLRAVQPTGRIVLQLSPGGSQLPDINIENGDRLSVPARPATVGVFGSVFNGGSFLYADGSVVADFLRLAGGPTKGADTGSVFVVRANGSVVSARQRQSGWLLGSNALDAAPAQPGDTIFVPEELNKTSFTQEAKEWTQILYQFGLGAAALKIMRN